MEGNFRWALVAAIAPIAWGSNYFVTKQLLPADHPLYGAAIRALPAGILLLLLSRRIPQGSWWWKSAVLGTLNVAAFFVLIYAAAQLLPTNVASTIMATSPVVMMLLAWLLLADRPKLLHLLGAALGIGGVCLMLFSAEAPARPLGVLASVAAMLMSSLGYVLAKKWSSGIDIMALSSWQLLAGGIVLLPVAMLFEGAPPALDGAALWGFGYVTIVATALAYVAWFSGLRHLGAGSVGLIGLLNPVTGVLLGTLIAGEALGAQQAGGLLLVLAGVLLGQPVAAKLLRRRRARPDESSPRGSTGPVESIRPVAADPARPKSSLRSRG
ncbi:DMT family transporter [Arthrobacter russicus]|uniref:Blue pigment (Indigoidine) exporter n=2 Tax=Bacteria TaxID=2 RepID=A0ABU1JF44_9MICC|nr:EamA family transporter [Arthrobacter russicus]MDR6271040.1 putative blue pigment (indigoidine) exporter [Arthrobacter russicus]